jgi:hypothetical protein
MSRDGAVRFERDGQGQLMMVLLLHGVPIARSRKAANIAAEVAFRNLDTLDIDNGLVVGIPTDRGTLDRAAGTRPAPAELAAAVELIAACAW